MLMQQGLQLGFYVAQDYYFIVGQEHVMLVPSLQGLGSDHDGLL